MTTLLFVDDDPLVLRGYKRSTDDIFEDWTVQFADSGPSALEILRNCPIDVLITDMSMPGMDGIDLLEQVSQDFPSVIRLVLSGNVENVRMLGVFQLAHQFLAKPCDMGRLRIVIERCIKLREVLFNPDLIRLTTGMKSLPSLPSLYVRLMKALQNESPSPQEIGDIIGQDVAMTAKVLQLVNSAFFGLPGKVTNPQRAVILLGSNTIKALVLGIHVFSAYEGYSDSQFSIDVLWQHSMMVGSIAREIAKGCGLDSRLQEDAQVAGILHDIGKLLQLKIPNFFSRVKWRKGKILLASEYKEFGASHAEIGAYLLSIWGLPENVIEAVAYHHSPTKQTAPQFGLLTILHAANGLYYLENSLEPENDYGLYLDMNYLAAIQKTESLESWRTVCQTLLARMN